MGQLRRDDSDRFFDYDIHLPSRTIYVGGEVDQEMADFFIKAMHLMLLQNSERITVITNNTGGDEYHGLAMYDAISCSHAPVTMVMYGHAMSMGSWIPQAADERIMSPNCTMMLHYGTSFGFEIDAMHVESHAREIDRLNKLMFATYLERIREMHPKYSMARLKSQVSKELYLTAEEAVELGLADKAMEAWS